MIDRYTSALRTGGLRPVGVDVKALSLTRSILPDPFFAEEGAVALLDVGSEITNLVITDGGQPVLTRSILRGFGEFVAAVADAADLPADEAEKQTLCPRVGLGHDQGEGGEETPEEDDFDPELVYNVRRGLKNAAQELAEGVQGSLEHHHSQSGSREVSRVLVSGEGALISGFAGYLSELLGIATGRGNPLERLAANHSNVSDGQLRAMEPVLAVAFGLALEAE
jgi:type IV pilus assembly protein PilM